MFASGNGPFGGGTSYIDMNFIGTGGPRQPGPYTDQINFHLTFIDSNTINSLGPASETDWYVVDRMLCCTQIYLTNNQCGPGVSIGGLIVDPNRTLNNALPPPVYSWTVSSTENTQGKGYYEVKEEGSQNALLVACDVNGRFALPSYKVKVDITFHNPYGYLPGTRYGLLPFYGFLFVSYLLTILVYAILMCRQRKHLLPLQYAIFTLLFISLLEMALWFFTYNSKNDNGIPTPCAVCPTTPDYMTAVVFSVIKRTVSHALLLAVALGYGVVKEKLPRRTTIIILGLSLAYFIVNTLNEVEQETSYNSNGGSWDILAFAAGVAFFIWIYNSLLRIQVELTSEQQSEKLRMYKSLMRVIMLNAAGSCIIAIVIICIQFGAVPFPWKSVFFLIRFWDLIYFFVLLAIVYIWAPGPTAYQYSLYSQPVPDTNDNNDGNMAGPDNALDDDIDEELNDATKPTVNPNNVEIEMTKNNSSINNTNSSTNTAIPNKNTTNNTKPHVSFDIEEDDLEDEEHDKKTLSSSIKKEKIDRRAISKGEGV